MHGPGDIARHNDQVFGRDRLLPTLKEGPWMALPARAKDSHGFGVDLGKVGIGYGKDAHTGVAQCYGWLACSQGAAQNREMESKLLAQALRLLGYRGYSVDQLRRKLLEQGSPQEVEQVLEQLLGWGYLNDLALAQGYVRTHHGRWGKARLVRKLREKGIETPTIALALAELGSPDEAVQVACQLLERHISRHRWERARAIRFLCGRGFSLEEAQQAWNRVQIARDIADLE